jgi:type VI secretion system Hcp family effector
MSVPSSPSGVPHVFLKIAEIKGEARSKGHDGEIEITEWSWGETQPVFPSDNRKGGNVSMRDLQFTAQTSCASAQFMLYCAAAKKIKTAVLTCEQDQGGSKHIYLTITFSNVVISSYQVSGTHAENQSNDSVSMKFTKIEFNYTPMRGEGVTGGNFNSSWDLSVNSAQ